jgi:hypothetical protein
MLQSVANGTNRTSELYCLFYIFSNRAALASSRFVPAFLNITVVAWALSPDCFFAPMFWCDIDLRFMSWIG